MGKMKFCHFWYSLEKSTIAHHPRKNPSNAHAWKLCTTT